MKLELLDYALPEDLIAARPPPERDGGRLMVLRGSDQARHMRVVDLPELVPRGALLVANDTRVIPARIFGRKPTGGKVEVLLLERLELLEAGAERWRALARASKGVAAGLRVAVEGGGLDCEVVGGLGEDGTLDVVLTPKRGSVVEALQRCGHVPLPPYVKRPDELADRDRYQTLFAKHAGAVAAPTAGLHLSERILAELRARDVELACVTLHVSLGTFQPVKVDDLDDHPMHAEWFEVSAAVAEAIASAKGRGAPVIAVGTTAVRALESAADPSRHGLVLPASGSTRMLIQPGYAFRIVDSLLTNFHLPRSTLLALVSAFAGTERILAAYRLAVAERYRFFSYGDAMFLDPRKP